MEASIIFLDEEVKIFPKPVSTIINGCNCGFIPQSIGQEIVVTIPHQSEEKFSNWFEKKEINVGTTI